MATRTMNVPNESKWTLFIWNVNLKEEKKSWWKKVNANHFPESCSMVKYFFFSWWICKMNRRKRLWTRKSNKKYCHFVFFWVTIRKCNIPCFPSIIWILIFGWSKQEKAIEMIQDYYLNEHQFVCFMAQKKCSILWIISSNIKSCIWRMNEWKRFAWKVKVNKKRIKQVNIYWKEDCMEWILIMKIFPLSDT